MHNRQHISHVKDEYYVVCDYLLEQYEQFKILGESQYKEETEMVLRLEQALAYSQQCVKENKEFQDKYLVLADSHIRQLTEEVKNLNEQIKFFQSSQEKNQVIMLKIMEMKNLLDAQKVYNGNKTLVNNL